MAFIVRRPAGRWEIRESVVTGAGPRARTLASFRVLTPEVVAGAAQAAARPFDPEAVGRAAWEAGAPLAGTKADAAARALLAEAAAGRLPAPALRRLVVDHLAAGGPLPQLEAGDGVAEWAAASLEERGRTLRDLLELADLLPTRRRGALRFPRLSRPVRG